MKRHALQLLSGCLAGILAVGQVQAQEKLWGHLMDQGRKALRQSQYDQAEELFLAAVKHAEKFRNLEAHCAASLNNLALTYYYQGRYQQAVPPFARALSIKERVFGPRHSEVIELQSIRVGNLLSALVAVSP